MFSVGLHHLPSHFCLCPQLLEYISFTHPKKLSDILLLPADNCLGELTEELMGG